MNHRDYVFLTKINNEIKMRKIEINKASIIATKLKGKIFY